MHVAPTRDRQPGASWRGHPPGHGEGHVLGLGCAAAHHAVPDLLAPAGELQGQAGGAGVGLLGPLSYGTGGPLGPCCHCASGDRVRTGQGQGEARKGGCAVVWGVGRGELRAAALARHLWRQLSRRTLGFGPSWWQRAPHVDWHTFGRMKALPAATASAIPTYACCSWWCIESRWKEIRSSFSFQRLKSEGVCCAEEGGDTVGPLSDRRGPQPPGTRSGAARGSTDANALHARTLCCGVPRAGPRQPEAGATDRRAAAQGRWRAEAPHPSLTPDPQPHPRGPPLPPAGACLWQLEIHGDEGAVGVVVRRVQPQAHVAQPRALAGDAVVRPGHVHNVRLHALGL